MSDSLSNNSNLSAKDSSRRLSIIKVYTYINQYEYTEVITDMNIELPTDWWEMKLKLMAAQTQVCSPESLLQSVFLTVNIWWTRSLNNVLE